MWLTLKAAGLDRTLGDEAQLQSLALGDSVGPVNRAKGLSAKKGRGDPPLCSAMLLTTSVSAFSFLEVSTSSLLYTDIDAGIYGQFSNYPVRN